MKVLPYEFKTGKIITATCIDVEFARYDDKKHLTYVTYQDSEYVLYFDLGRRIDGEFVPVCQRIFI